MLGPQVGPTRRKNNNYFSIALIAVCSIPRTYIWVLIQDHDDISNIMFPYVSKMIENKLAQQS